VVPSRESRPLLWRLAAHAVATHPNVSYLAGVVSCIFWLLGFILLTVQPSSSPSAFIPVTHDNSICIKDRRSFEFYLGSLLTGAGVVQHWHIYSISDTRSLGFLGTLLKLLAAVFFNMQPLTALLHMGRIGGCSGVTTTPVIYQPPAVE
jgi:hypothetical protein